MASVMLSDQFCRTVEPSPEGQPYVIFWDIRGSKGLGCTAPASAAFVLEYRHDGRSRRYSIGTIQNSWSRGRPELVRASSNSLLTAVRIHKASGSRAAAASGTSRTSSSAATRAAHQSAWRRGGSFREALKRRQQ
jgi:hypothetical protein